MRIPEDNKVRELSLEEVTAFLERFRQVIFRINHPADPREVSDSSPDGVAGKSAEVPHGKNEWTKVEERPGSATVQDRADSGKPDDDSIVARMDAARMDAFLAEFRSTLARRPVSRPPPTYDQIAVFFESFSEAFHADLEKQAEAAPRLNLWAAMGLGRYEVRNCRVLTWLLDRNASHSQGARFFRCLLTYQPHDGTRRCPVEKANQRYKVKREECLSEASRVDITVTGDDFRLLLEAKIGAALSEGQLERYWREAGYGEEKPVFGLFLTTDGTDPPEDSGFRPISWKNVAHALLCFGGGTDVHDDQLVARNHFVRLLSQQYANYILSEWKGK